MMKQTLHNRKNRRKRNNGGFTTVEQIVVIILMLILASGLVFGIMKWVECVERHFLVDTNSTL
ncbi:type II secretion system GspH family protein [[Clostridium] scindens]|uniref:type II secretion system protein n=1 Tax=Clostridium scindens (strain JCM 10418 / VPI 12708) TaxID=29347 RepID=UPI001D091AB1|nr:type II secretion system protein [[Clostridium] scindens]MCB6646338.1 type II secretion system GspH family protein [[Clostridium] scindens]